MHSSVETAEYLSFFQQKIRESNVELCNKNVKRVISRNFCQKHFINFGSFFNELIF